MKFNRALICVTILSFQLAPAKAWIHGNPVIGLGAQINNGDQNGGVLINALKQLSGGCCSGGNTPANFDSNGYPSGSLTANYGFTALLSSQAIFTGPSVQWEMLWPASCTLKFEINQAVNLVSSSNATTTGGSNSNLLVTTNSSAGNVIFTFPGTTSTMAFFFPTGFSNSCPGSGLAMVRVSDLTAYNAGQYFTPEYVADNTALNPSADRMMSVTNTNGSIQSKWSYRSTPSSISWNGNVNMFPPGAWGGSTSGTDTYTSAAAPDTPGTLTNGEVIILQVTNANTSTAPTLNVNSLGAVTIVNTSGLALSAGDLNPAGSSNGFYIFVYNSILNKWIFKSNGVNAFLPIEAQVQLANKIKASLWANIPLMAQDDWINQWSSYVCSNLNGGLYFYPEYSNEIWNFGGQTQTSLANQIGLALNFPNANGEPYHGWYGLRVRQAMGNLIPAQCSGHMSIVRRVMAFQEFGSISAAETYRFQGGDLNPASNSALCTYLGGTFTSSCSGAPNYSAQVSGGGNGWPIDVVEVASYANYTAGVNLCTGTDLNCTPGASNVAYYNTLLNAYENVSTAAAIALVDSDIRNGQTLVQTVTASGTTFTTPSAHGFTAGTTTVSFLTSAGNTCSGLTSGALYSVHTTPISNTFTMQAFVDGVASGADINAGTCTGTVSVGSAGRSSLSADMIFQSNVQYPLWEAAIASYDSGRPAGMAALRVELYEGALEPQGPSAAQCTSLGIVDSNCATNIAAAITAWKNDSTSAATTLVYANQFLGTDAATVSTFGLMLHSKTPSQLQLTGPSLWSLLPGDPGSTPYQTYNGWSQVRHN
jgi:hypothetical protein